jgi:hypothetical protein
LIDPLAKIASDGIQTLEKQLAWAKEQLQSSVNQWNGVQMVSVRVSELAKEKDRFLGFVGEEIKDLRVVRIDTFGSNYREKSVDYPIDPELARAATRILELPTVKHFFRLAATKHDCWTLDTTLQGGGRSHTLMTLLPFFTHDLLRDGITHHLEEIEQKLEEVRGHYEKFNTGDLEVRHFAATTMQEVVGSMIHAVTYLSGVPALLSIMEQLFLAFEVLAERAKA